MDLREALDLPQAQWEEEVDQLDGAKVMQLVIDLDELLQQAMRLRTYIAARAIRDHSHQTAVKMADRSVTQVRTAMRRTYRSLSESPVPV